MGKNKLRTKTFRWTISILVIVLYLAFAYKQSVEDSQKKQKYRIIGMDSQQCPFLTSPYIVESDSKVFFKGAYSYEYYVCIPLWKKR